MAQNKTEGEPNGLEPDERLTLLEEKEEKEEMRRLLEDKKVNYAMIRKLQPITSGEGMGLLVFIDIFGFPSYEEKTMRFQQWKAVEGGEIQIRGNPDRESDDWHGYVVVRPGDDKEHEIYLRVWDGRINSVVVLPRSDDPLPRQGQVKNQIIEQMELIPKDKIQDYQVWLERMVEAVK